MDLTQEQLAAVLAVNPEEWGAEINDIEGWFAKIGEKTPTALLTELHDLRSRLDQA